MLNRKISWQSDFDLVRKLYSELRATDLYKDYMASKTPSAKEDKQFLISVATEFLYEHDLLNHLFEEKIYIGLMIHLVLSLWCLVLLKILQALLN